LESVAVGVFALSFITALFPVLSDFHARQETQRYVITLRDYTIRILFFTIPMTIGMLLFRAHIVRLWFGHGKVDWTATFLLISTLGVLAFALVSQSLVPLFARAFYARQNTKTPMLISLVAMVINAVVSYFGALHYGVAGIALGFTMASIINAVLLFMAMRLQLGGAIEGMESLFDLPLLVSTMKIIFSTLAAGIASYSLLYLVAPHVNTQTVVGIFIQAAIAGLGGVFVYVALTYSMGFAEARVLRKLFRKK
jgi:putative peptidoglycan lipid II flippase